MELLTNYLNPLSPDFIFTKLFKNIGDLFNLLDPTGEKFIFTNFFKNIGNMVDWLNPFSDNFILKKLWEFLGNIISYINPFDNNFLGKKIIDLLGDLLKVLFVPSEERITGLQNTVMSKFDFINSIKTAISSFNDIINNLGNAPVLHLELGSTKYTDKMTVNVIDLNWYKPYKKYGDVVLTGVFYAFYLWRLYNRSSDIIRGVGSGAVDVINISEVQGGRR